MSADLVSVGKTALGLEGPVDDVGADVEECRFLIVLLQAGEQSTVRQDCRDRR